MESYRLKFEGGPPDDRWVIEWDEFGFALKTPDGKPCLVSAPHTIHQTVDLFDLYSEGKITFASPHGRLTFQKHSKAVPAFRKLVESGLASDPEYVAAFRRRSLRAIPRGLGMFFVAGALFGLYCWWAFTAPDPPPGHWLRSFGWLIHGLLLILLGICLAGPLVMYHGARQWLRFMRIARSQSQIREAEPLSSPDDLTENGYP